jgi:hypothetical protein
MIAREDRDEGVNEYWICQHCRSLNRAGTNRCYRCKYKYGSGPAPAGSLRSPAPVPAAPAAAPPVSATRQDLSLGSVPPAYLSKPIASAPVPASFTAAAAAKSRAPGLRGAIRGRLSRAMAMRPVVRTAWLGHLSVVLLVAMVVLGLALVAAFVPAGLHLLAHADPAAAWAQVPAERHAALAALACAFLLASVVCLVTFSAFVGLSTHNAPGLGAEMTMISPAGAAASWPKVVLRLSEIGLGILVPVALVWSDYLIPGLVVAVLALEVTVRRQDDPIEWLMTPAHHLPDLYLKLGIDGSLDSIVAWAWSAAFRLANTLAVVLLALPAVATALLKLGPAIGIHDIPGWASGSLGPAQLVVAVLAAGFVASAVVSIALLVPLTLGLVANQRTRRKLVRVGRARTWAVGRAAGAAPGPRSSGWAFDGDPEDRVIERMPQPAPHIDFGSPLDQFTR